MIVFQYKQLLRTHEEYKFLIKGSMVNEIPVLGQPFLVVGVLFIPICSWKIKEKK